MTNLAAAPWLVIVTTCAAAAFAIGLTACRGADPEAGRVLVVIGTLGLLCALAECAALQGFG